MNSFLAMPRRFFLLACLYLSLGLGSGPIWAAGGLAVQAEGGELRDLSAARLSCPSFAPISATWAAPQAAAEQPAAAQLLYLWSPRMVLSLQHAAEVQAVAQALGLVWRVATDPRVPAAEIAAALAAAPPDAQAALAASEPLCDAQVLAQGQSLRHFPTAWVYIWAAGQGSWQRQPVPIVSAMPPGFWRQAVQERLAAPCAKRANSPKAQKP